MGNFIFLFLCECYVFIVNLSVYYIFNTLFFGVSLSGWLVWVWCFAIFFWVVIRHLVVLVFCGFVV